MLPFLRPLIPLRRLGARLLPSRRADHDTQADLDRRLVYSLRKSRTPNWDQLRYIGRYLSPREKWVMRVSVTLLIFTTFGWSASAYVRNREVVPVPGGRYTEGLIGSPQYVNPLYAGVKDVDGDLTALIYSSLFRRNAVGELVGDLAAGHALSEDGKTYTIDLRSDARWHDGSPVTIDDVLFTVQAIQDPVYKSPLRGSLLGVAAAAGKDRQVVFTLGDPYAAFLEILDFGIMPAELWAQIPPESTPLAELNLKPIGSGPYRFEQLVKDKAGNIKEYSLVRNESYYGQVPYIDLTFKCYNGFDEALAALNAGDVAGLSYLPAELKPQLLTPKAFRSHLLSLPQVTALFFNQTYTPALTDKRVRQALAYGLDRRSLVDITLGGNAQTVDTPVLPSSFAYHTEVKRYGFDPEEANRLLDEAGWIKAEVTDVMVTEASAAAESGNETQQAEAAKILAVGAGAWRVKDGDYLIIDLKTVARKENDQVIAAIAAQWQQLGVAVSATAVAGAQFQSQVLKPRSFSALFYGQVLGGDPDPYVFWHSSQSSEQGFNIAGFVNKEVDQLLEDARLTTDRNVRIEKYRRFQDIIAEEVPAIYLYAPTYTYVQGNDINGFAVNTILEPRDRFANVSDWYLKTGKRLQIGE